MSNTITFKDHLNSGGLAGTQYIFVAANGTDTENATELQVAYTEASQSLSPSATNRITIVASPGNYNFGSSAFVMNTQYIDLVSLDGNRSVVFNSANSAGTISITANDVFVKGVDVLTKNFTVGSNLSLLKVENCKGGNNSFGSGTFVTSNGTFTDCVAGANSFGNNFGGPAAGTYINCTAGNGSFGAGIGAAATGIFINCVAGNTSFGSSGGAINSGTFTNCIAGDDSFGKDGEAAGTFTDCVGGSGSFGGGSGTLTGKLYFCRLTSGTFQTVSGGGITRLCLDGSNVENNQG